MDREVVHHVGDHAESQKCMPQMLGLLASSLAPMTFETVIH